jgi:2'-5' RNA ligase
MDEKSRLYFVAVTPDEEVSRQVHQIKLHIADQYNSKAALKSPPHITLYMPFRWKEEKEDRLFSTLSETASSYQPFPVYLKNFGAFEPRAIFVRVEENKSLTLLRKDIIKAFKRQLNIFDKGFEERPFRPHLTVGFRDLKKPMFRKAWEEEFKEKEFEARFEVQGITLLKHNGKHWEQFRNFGFEM